MDVNQLIDAQFRRAVEIVQSLPKQGPIQTGYEEKLAMYSLYKQATVGNVKTPRPGIWDMLGRAKWDAWAKHKDLPQHEAKWLYVDTLLKVLRKYSSQTVAMDLVHEIEAFQGDPSNLVLSDSYMSARRRNSDSGESSGSEDDAGQPLAPRPVPAHLMNNSRHTFLQEPTERPLSAVSSAHRYRTPLATSAAAFSPPPPGPMSGGLIGIPEAQPVPRYATQSTFSPVPESPVPSGSIPSSAYPSTTSAGGASYHHHHSSGAPTPTSYGPSGNFSPGAHGTVSHLSQLSHYVSPPHQPLIPVHADAASRYYSLETAIQKCQASLAALHERLDILETNGSGTLSRRSNPLFRTRNSGLDASGHGQGGPDEGADSESWHWDAQRYGAWALMLDPLTRGFRALRKMDDPRQAGPVLLVLRRLMLDASFVLCLLWGLRMLWRRSGVRARAGQLVNIARWLIYLLVGGERPNRVMVDRGTTM
ncbi:ACBP-domain-containing protein [Auriculariales sp. MPI-PUGE-AT-0066]|nr:ACBP-domain-containing protein [Auriculariales sp. MPI-PUGE-AT-0066]